jgi:hypothetical protein
MKKVIVKKAVKKVVVKKVVKKATTKAKAPKNTVNIAAIFRSQLDDTLKKNPSIVSVGLESFASVGVPLKSLSQEVLFKETCFPLGKIFCYDAMFGEFKSALVFETVNLWHRAGGFCMIVDTEKKESADFGASIVGYDDFEKVKYVETINFEAAQEACSDMIEQAKKLYEKEGKCFPVLIALDSTTGTLTDKENEAIRTQGHASIGFSQTANQTARWLKKLNSDIADVPITIIGTRHCKLIAGPMADQKIAIPKGCEEFHYHSYINFLLNKGQKIDLAHEYGHLMTISVKRGPNVGVKIPVRIMWHNEPVSLDSGVSSARQITVFDWDTATAKLLSDLKGCRIPQMYHQPLADVLGTVTFASGVISNVKLGLKKVRPRELTEALYDSSNESLLSAIRAALGILISYPFTADSGVTFEQAKQLQTERLNKIHRAPPADKQEDIKEETAVVPENDENDEYDELANDLTV